MTERHFDLASERAALDRWITREDECPAGGPHTPVDNYDEADDSGRRIYPGIHCDECGVGLPPEERDDY